jgi:hypothetical protein
MTAIAGTFSDFRTAKGRKVGILSIEIPIESVDATLRALGGFPQPHDPKWVGIALLDMKNVEEAAEKPRRRMSELTLPQQVVLTSEREAFQRFLVEVHHESRSLIGDKEATANAVRAMCGVQSRSSILPNTKAGAAWAKLANEFAAWMQEPA